MALTLRITKGSALTFDELDDNFTYLEGLAGANQASIVTESLTVTNNAIFDGATISFDGAIIPTFQSTVYYETKVDATSNTALNCAAGTIFISTPATDPSYTFNNPPVANSVYSMVLFVTPTANVNVTWPSGVQWAAQTAPTMPIVSDTTSIYSFITHDGGTTWYGTNAGDGFGPA